jgi:hypothetical protein
MTTYESYQDLAGCTLKEGDRLIFRKSGETPLYYKVTANHLACGGVNSHVFSLAGIEHEDRYKFCSEAYGYKASGGDFPVSSRNDFAALTRVALKLFKAIEEASGPAHFTSLAQLVAKGELHEGDTFELCGLRYDTTDSYFNNLGSGRNNKLLSILNIQDEDLDKIYGYESRDGDWPEWEIRDYKAAYRTLCYLFMVAEAKGLLTKEYDGSEEQKEDARYVIIELKKKQQALRGQRNHINAQVAKMKAGIDNLQNEIAVILAERSALSKTYDALDDEIDALKKIVEDC